MSVTGPLGSFLSSFLCVHALELAQHPFTQHWITDTKIHQMITEGSYPERTLQKGYRDWNAKVQVVTNKRPSSLHPGVLEELQSDLCLAAVGVVAGVPGVKTNVLAGAIDGLDIRLTRLALKEAARLTTGALGCYLHAELATLLPRSFAQAMSLDLRTKRAFTLDNLLAVIKYLHAVETGEEEESHLHPSDATSRIGTTSSTDGLEVSAPLAPTIERDPIIQHVSPLAQSLIPDALSSSPMNIEPPPGTTLLITLSGVYAARFSVHAVQNLQIKAPTAAEASAASAPVVDGTAHTGAAAPGAVSRSDQTRHLSAPRVQSGSVLGPLQPNAENGSLSGNPQQSTTHRNLESCLQV